MSVDLRLDGERTLTDGKGRRVALVCGRFNEAVTTQLVRGAVDLLERCGVASGDIEVHWAPGALEVPQIARAIVGRGDVDAVVGLGAVIKGDTYHFEVVCDASAAGLMQLSLEGQAVVTNGILTVYDEAQAAERSGDDERNKGTEAALAALETLAVVHGVRAEV